MPCTIRGKADLTDKLNTLNRSAWLNVAWTGFMWLLWASRLASSGCSEGSWAPLLARFGCHNRSQALPWSLLGVLAGSIWLPWSLLGVLAGSIWLPWSLLEPLAGLNWTPWPFLSVLSGSFWLPTRTPTLSFSIALFVHAGVCSQHLILMPRT